MLPDEFEGNGFVGAGISRTEGEVDISLVSCSVSGSSEDRPRVHARSDDANAIQIAICNRTFISASPFNVYGPITRNLLSHLMTACAHQER
jgi:hypothetical protein